MPPIDPIWNFGHCWEQNKAAGCGIQLHLVVFPCVVEAVNPKFSFLYFAWVLYLRNTICPRCRTTHRMFHFNFFVLLHPPPPSFTWLSVDIEMYSSSSMRTQERPQATQIYHYVCFFVGVCFTSMLKPLGSLV